MRRVMVTFDGETRGSVLEAIWQEAKREPTEKEVGIAFTTASKQAKDLDDTLRRLIDHLPRGDFKSPQAKRLKKSMGKLETTIMAYGHEVMPRLK